MRVDGTAQMIRFNWPKYLAAVVVVAAAAFATTAGTPLPVIACLWTIGVPALAWTLTSLAATWWVYDHRRVYEQLTTGLPISGAWGIVHAGFDASAKTLRASIGRPPSAVRQVALTARASLRRARKVSQHDALGAGADGPRLAPGSLDLVFVTFAAHEIRDVGQQRMLFREIGEALRPGGHLIVTEHPRDLTNFAVYGPGFLHFQPVGTWMARAAEAGLVPGSRQSITPFVKRLVWQR
jgi:SAM-dependent methyltransferase